MANSANISANASVHQPIRDRTHAGEAQACFRGSARPGKVMESWHIQFEKAE
ncbi:hypothetical protein SC499_08805 [Peribacillus simplex]|uniref:hypothetical protein n=1 Tax=Peribacillus simplex TaxID=1478 RepID=UPI00298E8E81|nr:hypothetical protein [Peribacillus simplex]MDW7614828.1 hypothetical protein [Peribacillus simplex]